MCEPVTLTIAALSLTAAAGGMKAYGQYQQGIEQQKYYQYLADTSRTQGEYEYRTGMRESELTQDAASFESKQEKIRTTQFASSQKAKLIANGVDLSSVTAQDISTDTMSKAQMDQLLIRYKADSKSWSQETDANYKKWAGEVDAQGKELAGRQAKASGKRKAFTTLLATAGTLAAGAATAGALGVFSGGGGGGSVLGGNALESTGSSSVAFA